ncbi:MAG: hypothetical protein HKP27_08410 [Myxococcales bacterium]|nr:hypothetical protein [Myxococcales bacterium]
MHARNPRLNPFRALALSLVAAALAACQTPAPVVNVQAPPCDCACNFKATTPQIGKGCHVQGDVLICPLVRRTLDIEPAYPTEDPRCERQADGTMACEIID